MLHMKFFQEVSDTAAKRVSFKIKIFSVKFKFYFRKVSKIKKSRVQLSFHRVTDSRAPQTHSRNNGHLLPNYPPLSVSSLLCLLCARGCQIAIAAPGNPASMKTRTQPERRARKSKLESGGQTKKAKVSSPSLWREAAGTAGTAAAAAAY